MTAARAGQTTGGDSGNMSGSGGSTIGGEGGAGATAAAGGQAGGEAGDGTGAAMGGMAGAGGSRVAGGSGGGSGDSCRQYATEYTRTSSGEFEAWTCAFDRPSVTTTCTSDVGDVRATTWAGIENAVAENRPVGSRRAERTTETIAFSSRPCRLTRDFSHSHDGYGRLTAVEVTIDPTAPCGTSEVTYDAWDAAGRPTHGIENGVGGELCAGQDVSLTYDDALRTITSARSGGTDCLAYTSVSQYDEDGIPTTSMTGAIVTTYDTLQTGEICE
jgi:hypothetical protein